MTSGGGQREAELATALGAVRARISRACEVVGRDPREVTMIAVTKTCPAADVATLARLGVGDVGESKDQEATAKLAELALRTDGVGSGLRWHVVGRVQTNKARSVASYAHAVHSVDRVKLVRSLADAATEREHPLQIFVQVSLDGDPQRGGVDADGLDEVTDAVAARPELRLAGLMAVPPIGADAGQSFEQLAALSMRVRASHPDATALSAGMSGDLDTAIAHGSTHVRVGTALLGRRAPVFG